MHDNISAHLQYQNISAQLQHICSTFAAPEHFSAIVAHLQHVCSTFATYLQNQNISAQLQHIYNTFSACLQHICSTITFQHICSTFQHNCSTFQHILFLSSVTKLGLRFGLPKGSPNQKLESLQNFGQIFLAYGIKIIYIQFLCFKGFQNCP